jgi:hypothetical protein
MPNKDKPKGRGPTQGERVGATLFGAMLGLPAQVRLNELGPTAPVRPVPFVPPKKKGKR